jgi:hypothetical protein
VAAATVAVFWLSGYFLVGSAGDLGSGGFGRYSMNLLSAVTGQGYSRLLPPIAVATDGQYEGLIYFGAGWLVLSAVGLVLLARRHAAWPPLGVGWLVVLTFLALAISPVVTIGSTVVADLLAWTPARLGVFRSSGRFAWLAMYVVFTAALGAIVTALPRRAAVSLAAAALLLQAVDLSGAYRRIHDRAVDSAWTEWTTPLQNPAWPAATVHYRHLVTVGPDMCAGWPAAGPHLPFSLLAGRAGATMNSGFAGRYDLGAVQEYCRTLREAMADGRVDDDSLYVLSPAERRALAAVTRTPLACGVADGFDVCVTAATFPRWRDAALAAGVEMVEVPAAR